MRASDRLDRETDPELPAICGTAFALLGVGFLPTEKPLENFICLLFAVSRIGVQIEDQPTRQFAHTVFEQLHNAPLVFFDSAIPPHRHVRTRRSLPWSPVTLLSLL